MGNTEENRITEDDIDECWGSHATAYFAELLNGDCSLEDTVSDLRSLIGSKYDPRCSQQGANEAE